jgi:hypothetical protein
MLASQRTGHSVIQVRTGALAIPPSLLRYQRLACPSGPLGPRRAQARPTARRTSPVSEADGRRRLPRGDDPDSGRRS